MMTKDFEPITEVGIHQDDFGEGTVTLNKLVVSLLSLPGATQVHQTVMCSPT